ncbi:hypothetical protein Tco_0489736 [Tanacetum coccineum]
MSSLGQWRVMQAWCPDEGATGLVWAGKWYLWYGDDSGLSGDGGGVVKMKSIVSSLRRKCMMAHSRIDILAVYMVVTLWGLSRLELCVLLSSSPSSSYLFIYGFIYGWLLSSPSSSISTGKSAGSSSRILIAYKLDSLITDQTQDHCLVNLEWVRQQQAVVAPRAESILIPPVDVLKGTIGSVQIQCGAGGW